MKKLGMIAGTLILAVATNAGVVTWDGDAADGLWDTAANWSSDTLPAAGDDVFISNGDTVAGTEFNSAWNITLSGNSTLAKPVTSFAGGAWRASGASVTVNPGSTLGNGGFWDLQNATLTFEDGAAVNMQFWEQKSSNEFNFNLSTAGFSAITPGSFMIGNDGVSVSISNAVYNVDMNAYTGGLGTIVLADFGSDGYGMDDSLFQTAGGLNVNNAGSYAGSYLQWNDTDEAIELVVIPEPASMGLLGLSSMIILAVRRYRS